MASEFSRRLQTQRKQKKLSQVELAQLCAIGVASVSCYENGTRLPSYATLLKLADHLGTSPNYLLTGNEVFNSDVEIESFIREQPNLRIFGEPVTETIRNDILMALRIVWEISKGREKTK